MRFRLTYTQKRPKTLIKTNIFWKLFETAFENVFSVDGWTERRLFKNGDVRKNGASTDFVMF